MDEGAVMIMGWGTRIRTTIPLFSCFCLTKLETVLGVTWPENLGE